MNGAEQLHFVCQFDLRLINRINGDITQTEDVVLAYKQGFWYWSAMYKVSFTSREPNCIELEF